MAKDSIDRALIAVDRQLALEKSGKDRKERSKIWKADKKTHHVISAEAVAAPIQGLISKILTIGAIGTAGIGVTAGTHHMLSEPTPAIAPAVPGKPAQSGKGDQPKKPEKKPETGIHADKKPDVKPSEQYGPPSPPSSEKGVAGKKRLKKKGSGDDEKAIDDQPDSEDENEEAKKKREKEDQERLENEREDRDKFLKDNTEKLLGLLKIWRDRFEKLKKEMNEDYKNGKPEEAFKKLERFSALFDEGVFKYVPCNGEGTIGISNLFREVTDFFRSLVSWRPSIKNLRTIQNKFADFIMSLYDETYPEYFPHELRGLNEKNNERKAIELLGIEHESEKLAEESIMNEVEQLFFPLKFSFEKPLKKHTREVLDDVLSLEPWNEFIMSTRQLEFQLEMHKRSFDHRKKTEMLNTILQKIKEAQERAKEKAAYYGDSCEILPTDTQEQREDKKRFGKLKNGYLLVINRLKRAVYRILNTGGWREVLPQHERKDWMEKLAGKELK